MILGENETIMKFFNRSKHDCQNLCQLYKATKTITSEGVINQFKCTHCNYYLLPSGVESSRGNKLCLCCGNNVVYVRSIADDLDVEETKKSTPNSFTKRTFGRKSFEEFLEFIEDEIQLQTNYQLVVLKFIIGSKMSEKIKIAEELTYQNNKNFNDRNEVKKFLSVLVYDVLEDRGFIKKIIHHDKEQYILNVEMNEFDSIRSIELLDKKLKEYNLEHNIPENQYDDLFNEEKIVKDNSSYTNQVIIESKNNPEPPVIDDTYQKVVKSENETITIIENFPSGIRLKEFTEIKSEDIHKGQILSNDDLINKFGVGNMGGIRHSKKNNLLVLCSTLSKDYTDSLDAKSGLYVYSGEGQTDDQELTKGNKKILDSEYQMFFLQEKYQEPGARKRGALDNLYEFVGSVNYVKHFWVDETDKEGNLRKVVKFVLEVES